MDAFAWAHEATAKLQEEFGNRLVFAGLQGSRARGEAHEGSDIDLVVILDHANATDLTKYRTIIQSMPHTELACGFVGAADVLAAWPRHELFQFTHDTRAILGDLTPIVGTFTREDALQAARIGASGIYHAACHAFVFDDNAIDDILQSLFKGAFSRCKRFISHVRESTRAQRPNLLGTSKIMGLKTKHVFLRLDAAGQRIAPQQTSSARPWLTCSSNGRERFSKPIKNRKKSDR